MIGAVGELSVSTRGIEGPGEIMIRTDSGHLSYTVWSSVPLQQGSLVLVTGRRDEYSLFVEQWNYPVF